MHNFSDTPTRGSGREKASCTSGIEVYCQIRRKFGIDLMQNEALPRLHRYRGIIFDGKFGAGGNESIIRFTNAPFSMNTEASKIFINNVYGM